MKFITNQVDVATEAIRMEKPILKLVKGYYSGIVLELNDKPKWDEEAIASIDKAVMNAVKQHTRTKLLMDLNKYQVRTDTEGVVNQIMYMIEQDILEFIRHHGGHTNNRLSKLFKWYRDNTGSGILRRNEKYAQDLYNITKFIDGNPTEEQIKTARILLTLIKDRYEPMFK